MSEIILSDTTEKMTTTGFPPGDGSAFSVISKISTLNALSGEKGFKDAPLLWLLSPFLSAAFPYCKHGLAREYACVRAACVLVGACYGMRSTHGKQHFKDYQLTSSSTLFHLAHTLKCTLAITSTLPHTHPRNTHIHLYCDCCPGLRLIGN